MINIMQKYLTNKIKPNYPYYKFIILNTSKYIYEIIDILKDVIGECEVVSYEGYSIIFYFNNVDFDFKSLIKTINDDFYIDAHLFESGKIQFNDGSEFHQLLDIYNKANLQKYTYSSNKNIIKYLTRNSTLAKELAPIVLNKMIKDESLLILANQMFECDLNISLTAKSTYMHRNTVNYKLGQIKEETDLDIRCFKDAVIMYEFLKKI